MQSASLQMAEIEKHNELPSQRIAIKLREGSLIEMREADFNTARFHAPDLSWPGSGR